MQQTLRPHSRFRHFRCEVYAFFRPYGIDRLAILNGSSPGPLVHYDVPKRQIVRLVFDALTHLISWEEVHVVRWISSTIWKILENFLEVAIPTTFAELSPEQEE